MIRCFKCDAPATQGPDGVIHMSCDCFPPRLARYAGYTDTSGTTDPNSKYTVCHDCLMPVFKPEFHHCKGIGATSPIPAEFFTISGPESITMEGESTFTPDEIQPDMAMRIYEKLTHRVAEHKRTCGGCIALGRSCIECIQIEDIRDKWKKKAEVQP